MGGFDELGNLLVAVEVGPFAMVAMREQPRRRTPVRGSTALRYSAKRGTMPRRAAHEPGSLPGLAHRSASLVVIKEALCRGQSARTYGVSSPRDAIESPGGGETQILLRDEGLNEFIEHLLAKVGPRSQRRQIHFGISWWSGLVGVSGFGRFALKKLRRGASEWPGNGGASGFPCVQAGCGLA